MEPIKNSQFLFIDDDNTQKIFLREKYFKFVCLLITDYFNEEIVKNDFYYYFVNLLNNLEDYTGVYFIEHQIPPHWALSIIQNKHTIDVSDDNEVKLREIWTTFKKQNNLVSFIVDNNIPM